MKIKITLVLLITFLVTTTGFAQNADTLFYSVVKGKDISGIQKMWMKGDQEYHFFYKYNDRGRGDSVYAAIITGNSGQINKVVVEGVDYMKNAYNESFEIVGDSAVSIVNSDREVKPIEKEIYFGQGSPGFIEPVIKYLLQQPDGKATVFGGGSTQAIPLMEKHFSSNGKKIQLYLCELYYNENTPPFYAWLDQDKHFFANVNDWFSTIRSGYESLNDTLNTVQEMQAKNYYIKQMKALSDSLPAQFAVTKVRVFDAEHAMMLENMTVLISNGKVTAVEKSNKIKIPKGYQQINSTGKTLLPGLWDTHGHYDKGEGLNYLAGGVTHVRDMGNSNHLLLTRDAIRNNEVLGPDISYVSGFIDQAGPFQGPTGAIVHNLNEGIEAVDDYAKRGYQQIKLYSSVDPKWVAPLATEAHRLGLRVAGHIPSFMTATQAVNDGYNEITHMNMVMLNFLGDTIDTRSRKRFLVVADRAKDLDLNSKEVTSFISLLKEKNISLDPTMNVFAEMFTIFPGDTNPVIKPVINWMPADQRQELEAQTSLGSMEKKPAYLASFQNMMLMLKKLYDNEILIVSGTDGGEAFALEHELELYVQAGIPPLNALQCATYNAAKDCNLLNQYGTIAVGKPADMILIDGNPGVNISDIRRVEWVVKNSRMYDPKKLFASIGWSYYH
ncbi:MAG: amidohydrolase family protein [Chitinophagales bacterium]|nr:amidohydrolase family protein [Chitinophagales bacterium]